MWVRREMGERKDVRKDQEDRVSKEEDPQEGGGCLKERRWPDPPVPSELAWVFSAASGPVPQAAVAFGAAHVILIPESPLALPDILARDYFFDYGDPGGPDPSPLRSQKAL